MSLWPEPSTRWSGSRVILKICPSTLLSQVSMSSSAVVMPVFLIGAFVIVCSSSAKCRFNFAASEELLTVGPRGVTVPFAGRAVNLVNGLSGAAIEEGFTAF